MELKVLVLTLMVGGICCVPTEGFMDYLRAYRIGIAISPVIRGSNSFDCRGIAAAMLQLANPTMDIDLESAEIQERLGNVMRMAKDTAIRSRQIGYIRLFNGCLIEMGRQTAPTGQYILFDSTMDANMFSEFNNPVAIAYRSDPETNPKPDYMVDLILSTDIMMAIEITEDITHIGKCSMLAKTMLEMANEDEEGFDLTAPETVIRIKKVHELALMSALWSKQVYLILKFHKCLMEFGAEVPPTAFYVALIVDESRIPAIELPEEHTRRVGDSTNITLD